MNTHLMRVVALSAAILAPVCLWLDMIDIALALAACSAVAGVMAVRSRRRSRPEAPDQD